MDINEDVLNVLLADGLDVPTAIAASTDDRPPGPRRPASGALWCGFLAGVIATGLVYWLTR